LLIADMGGYRRNIRSYSGGGFSMGFPPFTPAIKWLVISNAAIYLLMLVLGATAPTFSVIILRIFALQPYAVLHGWIWQLVTYSFLHLGLMHLGVNMLTLWMFGATLESEWGREKFLELYFFGAVGAALTTIGVAYLVTAPLFDRFQQLGGPLSATAGASGAVYAIMVAFAMLHGDQEFFLFPFPFRIRAKYLVGILIFVALASSLQISHGQPVAYVAHLGGAFFGWLYVRAVPRRGLGFAFSERYFGLRNSYYRWKRRRAARKFEVYMRRHDRKGYFDEYGNFRDPGEDDKGNGQHRDKWVQ
jgi:membrane associated rhomboid family serine protease